LVRESEMISKMKPRFLAESVALSTSDRHSSNQIWFGGVA